MQCEDEWSEMRQRFKKEGLDADTLKLEDRLLQVWRWLVDAESNLRNSRRMLDKLYEQQHEEIEEMENYVGKMKKLAEKRATDIEAECSGLKHEKTELLELLDGFGALGDSIYEKVLFLGEEKVKAAEDLEILKNLKLPSNGVNSDILTEMIKVSSEKESLKREVTEMRERVHLLEKSSRQLEIDNDRLSFKGDCFVSSRFWYSSSFTLSSVFGFSIVVLMVFGAQSLSASPLVIDLNASCKKLDRFWTHTGFSPLDSSYQATESLLLSKDEKINLALISALPNRSISHVRIHWLLNLVYRKNLEYNWTKLDEILDWIVTLKLNMIFEIMGLPLSKSSPDSLNWRHFCSEIANHLLARYGQKVVENWMFELWNEPDLKQYNIANFTISSYIDYSKSCIDGIRSQIPNAVIGGPAGLFKNTTNHKLCWGFLEECNSLRNRCNINFISFHKKAFPEDLLAESLKLAHTIQRKFPTLSKLPFFNSEADLMTGWWKPRGWRGDVFYAASIVQVVHLFIVNNLQNLFMGISNDNGFLNTSPFFFDQRTLLTRFSMSSSNSTQFFKKPVYVATALLGKLENNVLSIRSECNSSLSVIPSINSCHNASSSTVILTNLGRDNSFAKSLEIVLPSSWGPVMYSFHVLSNSLDHPKKIWKRYGQQKFPNRFIRELIRQSEEPHLIVLSETSKFINLSFSYPSPSVGLVQVCTRQVDKPQMVSDLNALNISYNEVLLFWRDDSRCISTYEVEFCPQEPNEINCFRRINKANIILCSFQHADYSASNEEHIRGTYRVRAVDIWGRAGPYSSTYHYPDIVGQ